MFDTLSRRTLTAAAALAFVAGCSGNPASLAPGQSSAMAPSARRAGPGMRVLRGPAVTGPIVVPLVAHPANLPHAWPKTRSGQILFVSDATNNQVLMYDPKTANPTPLGSITNGLNVPFGLAIDSHGALYVANLGNNTITVYPAGASSPSLTISNGVNGPYGIGVDSKGNVFATNLNDDTVVAFAAGATTPYETIDFTSEGQGIGLGIDASDNVWIGSDTTSQVWEIPAGSSTPQNAGLSGLDGSTGVSFGKNGMMYVSNFGGSNVTIYAPGTTSPARTLTSGIETHGPTLSGFASSGRFFQSNQGLNVVGYKGYKKNQTSPFSTITGNTNPTGIAGSPLIKK
ncbi:MAG TPA: hypothetical protein VIJ77_08130 [Candidatus Tumulicola sp.]